jgi:uncharacterized GH25 family protein
MNTRHIRKGLLLALLLPTAALAHKGWLMPSKTVLNVNQWITVDAGTSSDPFIKDHNAMRLDNLLITAPDGSTVAPENLSSGKLRSTFDLQLTQNGTYRIAVVNDGINASWEQDGQNKRWPPRGTPFTAEGFAKEVPKKAKNLKVTQTLSRLETFATAGKPDNAAVKPTGKGLELVAISGINEWYSGEEARFQFLIDGKPAANIKVEVIADGVRYRNAVNGTELTTDAEGRFAVQWPAAGMYWLGADAEDEKAEKPAKERRLRYAATLEVLSP